MVDISDREAEGLEWRGYVKAKLEGIGEKLEDIDKKMGSLDRCVNKMKTKVAAIGGSVSIAITILVLLIKEILAK